MRSDSVPVDAHDTASQLSRGGLPGAAVLPPKLPRASLPAVVGMGGGGATGGGALGAVSEATDDARTGSCVLVTEASADISRYLHGRKESTHPWGQCTVESQGECAFVLSHAPAGSPRASSPARGTAPVNAAVAAAVAAMVGAPGSPLTSRVKQGVLRWCQHLCMWENVSICVCG